MRKILLVLVSMLILSSVVNAHIDENWDDGVIYWTIISGVWSGVNDSAVDGGKYITSTSSGTSRNIANYSYGDNHSYFSVWMNRTIATTAEMNIGFAFEYDSTSAMGDPDVNNQCSNPTMITNVRALCVYGILNTPYVEGLGFTYTPVALPSEDLFRYEAYIVGSNARIRIYYLNGTLFNEQVVTFTHLSGGGSKDVKLWVGSQNAQTVAGNFDDLVIANSDPDSAPTGTIDFTADSYNLGDIAYIDATLTNPDYDSYGYRTIIYNPDGTINHAHMWAEPTTSQAGFSINIEQLGTYTAKIQKFTNLFSYSDLDTDTAVGKYQNDALMSVYFNNSYYNTGDTVLIQSNVSNINNSLYFYEIMIIKPNGNFYNVHNITANESYSFITNVPGEWQVALTSYPKSDSSWIENQVSDSMVTYGTGVGASWVAFNDTYYYKNSWARIDYGISVNDFYDSHKMQITNQEGTVVFDRQIIAQSGYFDYYFYESGKYTVTIDRNWFALDWDLTDNEILATDVTEVTNTIEGGFTLGVTPTTLNCGQTVYLSAETPNIWNTSTFDIKDVNGTLMKNIAGQAGSWKTNQTGQFWVYLNDGGAVQDTGYFYVYGTCTGYDVMNPDGSGGIKPKPYPQTDQATSNAALQNNLLYFMGLPIFWGMIIFIGVLIVAAVNKASAAIPYLAPGILLFEAVVGLLDPYSSFIIVGFAIVAVMYFIGNFVANRAGN